MTVDYLLVVSELSSIIIIAILLIFRDKIFIDFFSNSVNRKKYNKLCIIFCVFSMVLVTILFVLSLFGY